MKESIQVLCATMHQKDFSKAKEMNINNCDVIFANQGGQYRYDEETINGYIFKMITTDTIGVGKNRNFSLAIATGEILVLADDDLVYEDDFVRIVEDEFRTYPDAEMIVFGIRYAINGKVFKEKVPKRGRLKYTKALRYGTCSIAVKRKAVLKYNLHFSELFGGGCIYSYGEDTDFITQCFKAKMKIYSSDQIIATTSKDTSTCYNGYGEKFYYDKGALARYSLGLFALPYMLKMTFKRLGSELSFLERIKCMYSGYKGFLELHAYEKWNDLRNEKNSNSKQ